MSSSSESNNNNNNEKMTEPAAASSSPPPPPSSSNDANKTKKKDYKKIVEGSSVMVYPANQEQAVFYNPVQVQNRDLSVLMISLYAERRAVRWAMAAKRKELRSQQKGGEQLQKELQEYESHLRKQPPSTTTNGMGGLHVLDALAASGLRSMRYWKEIQGIEHITINDLDQAAVERAHDNVEENNLTEQLLLPKNNKKNGSGDNGTTTQPREGGGGRRQRGIRIRQGDATHLMYNSRRTATEHQARNNRNNNNNNNTALQQQRQERENEELHYQEEQWDVIDLDPYGSAAPFLDGAVQAVRDGGLLNVTCTDMAALGGSHPETCYGRYGSLPIQRAKYLQEAAVRILLQSIAHTAARYGRTIRPILSVGMNFYVRCFVEVHHSKAAVNDLSLSVGSVYQSTRCPTFVTVPRGQFGKNHKRVYQPTRAPHHACPETGGQWKVGGPLWLGPLHDMGVVQQALDRLPRVAHMATKERIQGLLFNVSQELNDVPLYYTLPDLSHTLHCTTPPLLQVKSALLNAGYRVSGYHKEPQAIKTDAPNQVVWDIMRAWCQKHPPSNKKKKKKKNNNNNDNNTTTTATTRQEEESAAEKILKVEPSIQVDFTVRQQPTSSVARFPMNPEKNWGPKPRASGKRKREEEEEGNSREQD